MKRYVLAVAALPVMVGVGAAGAATTPSLRATLTSRAEVPKSGPGGSGSVVITLDTTTGQACWTFTINSLAKILAAHVHQAPRGKSGPVIIPLGARFRKTGCVQTKPKVLKAVLANPSAYYVNVHTRKYVNGAIRGQLHT
jgi:hypothetical protein